MPEDHRRMALELDWKTINAMLVSGTPAAILALGAGITAFKVTRKVEELKLKAQADLERERMEFQRESEAQKQRMELYKALYLERIAALKEVSRLAEAMHTQMVIHASAFGEGAPVPVEELSKSVRELSSAVNGNAWIIGPDILPAVQQIANHITPYDEALRKGDAKSMLDTVSAAKKALGFLNSRIADDMHDYQLAWIMNPRAVPPEASAA